MTGGLVSCVVGARQYAMRGTDVREIVRAERMRRSNGRDGTVGTLSVNRETIPVYSLRATLDGASPSESASTTGHHIVVTPSTGGPIGWLADRIVRSHMTDELEILPLPPVVATVATAWFEGLLIVDGTPVLLLSPRHLDPRAARDRAETEAPCEMLETAPTPPSGHHRPPLIVMFSSPALPQSGAARYALSARRIAAVVQSLAVTPVPGCPPHVAGVAVWRNHVMPVVDFRSTDERNAAASGSRYLIARCGRSLRGGSVAFHVDSELILHQPTRDDRKVEDIDSPPPFVAGTFTVSGERLALLDLDTLLLTGLAG